MNDTGFEFFTESFLFYEKNFFDSVWFHLNQMSEVDNTVIKLVGV